MIMGTTMRMRRRKLRASAERCGYRRGFGELPAMVNLPDEELVRHLGRLIQTVLNTDRT
jgi:hypothetical protein